MKKRSRTASVAALCVALLAAGAIGIPQAMSQVVACLPTDAMRDGIPLTARLVNPGAVAPTPPADAVTDDVDAFPCDIGIYYNLPGNYTVDEAHIHGARYFGVLANNPGVNVTIDESSIFDIQDDPVFTGVQRGVGLSARAGAHITITRSQVYDYQKNGFVASDPGTRLDVIDSVVRGKGPTPTIAQNGIQFSFGAGGSAVDNYIKDHVYTGCSQQDARETGCSYVVSTGILLFDVDKSLVEIRLNLFRDNDFNILNAQ